MEEQLQNMVKPENKRYFLITVLLMNIIAALNTSTVTISIPTYLSVFGVDINTVQWVVIGYMLPLCMMMPLSGYWCERYSYRRTFLTGVLLLGICSLGCACSVNFFMLVVFRFLKGIAGGILIPSSMSMLYRYIPKQQQAGYLGTVVLFQNMGFVLGPTLAGILLEVSSWHVLFLFNIPFVLLAFWAGKKSIPVEAGRQGNQVDFIGVLQISLGTGMVMFAFTKGEVWGWSSVAFWVCLLTGLALVVTFIIRQFRTQYPLLNFAVLRYKPFVLTLLVQCTLAMTLGINAILSQFYFQSGRGFSPGQTGLILMGPTAMMLLGNTVASYLHKRGFVKGLISGGMLLALLGNLGLCRLMMDSNIFYVVGSYALRFFGLALIQMPLTNYGLGSVTPQLAGHASSMFNWAKQMVQVVSTNILTVLLSLNLGRYYYAMGHTGIPQEGTMDYRFAAIEAVNTDYKYLAFFLLISLCCTFLIRTQDGNQRS